MDSSREKYVPAHKPLGRYRRVSILSAFLLCVAFLLLLLVSLSLPIIKPIYLLSLRSTTPVASQELSIATELRFGVWGVCATSVLDPATPTSNPGLCFGPMLGYTVPPALAAAVGVSQSTVDAVEKALVVVLVLHPIAAGLAALCLIPALFLASHAFSILVLVITIALALLSSVALAIDVALVLVARAQLAGQQTVHLAVGFGDGVWMIFGAVIATWAAVLTLSVRACYCLGTRRPGHHRHSRHRHHHSEGI